MPDESPPLEKEIREECRRIADFLVDKNRKYGSAVEADTKVFSKLGWRDRIAVRMDDKLTRLQNQQPDETEDTKLDLLGYLILGRVLDSVENVKKARGEDI